MPNLFVIGAMKAGTTALYSLLNNHPLIYMAPIKEPNFYCSDLWDVSTHITPATYELVQNALRETRHNTLLRDKDMYASLFPGDTGEFQYYGEASPLYLRSKVAAKKIYDSSPDAKIIVLIRDPIERACSHYLMEYNEGRVPADFMEMMDNELRAMQSGSALQHGILESGLYYQSILRFSQYFTRPSLLVLDYNELRDTPSLFDKLNDFLAFDENYFAQGTDLSNPSVTPRFKKLNQVLAAKGVKELIRKSLPQSVIEAFKAQYYKTGSQRYEITEDIRKKLQDCYSEDIQGLVSFLGGNAPDWTKQYLGNE